MAGKKQTFSAFRVWKDGALIGSGQWLGKYEAGTWEIEWYDEDAQDAFKKILESDWDAAYTPIPDERTTLPPEDLYCFSILMWELGFELSLDINDGVAI